MALLLKKPGASALRQDAQGLNGLSQTNVPLRFIFDNSKMPDAKPARLLPTAVLEEVLANLFDRLQAEPASDLLLSLVDDLETAHRGSRVAQEQRTIA
jgi:hypothetical protein